ncbi:hypothetical protein [Blastopirellula marina]|uniref:Uncharacterized protein n=1 Tax=Blastopirellula marina TaxID=124 RepID=A0A2S8GP36_9BACT|nr:hypothetical protein [Blastopirellula marina]PQO46182.1 hypothetical protein C5Y93_09345 [Blastopirellula marina]
MKLSVWQWLTILWLVVLHLGPYVVVFTGTVSSLLMTYWVLFSAPLAQGTILGAQLIYGGAPTAWRRLIAVAGNVTLLTVTVMLAGQLLIFLGLQAMVVTLEVTLGGWLASRFLRDLPSARTRSRKVQFDLWEVVATIGLIGVLLAIVSFAGGDPTSLLWQLLDPSFVALAVSGGLFGLACSAVVIASSLRRRVVWGIGSVLLWGVLPWIHLAVFYPFFSSSLSPPSSVIFAQLYPTLGFQAVMIWGTLLPLRMAFPGFLRGREPQAGEEEMPSEAVESEDFAEMR